METVWLGFMSPSGTSLRSRRYNISDAIGQADISKVTELHAP